MNIESYSFGKINIDGETYTSDVIIFPDHVKSNWWRKSGHNLVPEDLNEVFDATPNLLIVGTGNSGMMSVPDSTKQVIRDKNIDLIVESTGKATDTYNRMKDSGQKVVAAFHLTC